jgi:hypothetical protein
MISTKLDKWTSGNDTSVEEGGNQIEYGDQPRHLHKIWLDEIDKNGVASEMGGIFDEEKIRAEG